MEELEVVIRLRMEVDFDSNNSEGSGTDGVTTRGPRNVILEIRARGKL
jgi:hypothetical protein